MEKFVVLAVYFEPQTDCNKYRKKISQTFEDKSFVEEAIVFTFPYQTNGNHATEPSTVGNVILRTALERYLQIFRLVFQFSLKLDIKI